MPRQWQLYIGGLTNYLDVVVAQETALTARIVEVQAQVSRLQAGVTLIRALGGGWNVADLPSEDGVLPFGPLGLSIAARWCGGRRMAARAQWASRRSRQRITLTCRRRREKTEEDGKSLTERHDRGPDDTHSGRSIAKRAKSRDRPGPIASVSPRPRDRETHDGPSVVQTRF
jgi:hypothetical protein